MGLRSGNHLKRLSRNQQVLTLGAPHKNTIDEPGSPQRNQLDRTTSFDKGQATGSSPMLRELMETNC